MTRDFIISFSMNDSAFEGVKRGPEIVSILRHLTHLIEISSEETIHDGFTVAVRSEDGKAKIGRMILPGSTPMSLRAALKKASKEIESLRIDLLFNDVLGDLMQENSEASDLALTAISNLETAHRLMSLASRRASD